jgi:ABC-type phosphate transport system substrate-binding protein
MRNMRLASFAAWALLGVGALQAQVIVANAGVKSSEISKSDLSDIFTGASSNFGDGSHAVPATLKGGPVHEAFLKTYIGKKDLLFRGDWRVLVFSGKATMPQAFETEEELLHYVASVPGAIGYASSAPHTSGVKSLAVK